MTAPHNTRSEWDSAAPPGGLQAVGPGISRRRFIRNAGAATLAASDLLSSRALAKTSNRRSRARPTVAVFGGGIAGLTAAHELAERGFGVTLYERRAWGGKARSTEVPHSATAGHKPLPGEHSWRLFAGFYQNIPDTMRRIPFGSNPNGVYDNLTSTNTFLFTRDGERDDFAWDIHSVDQQGLAPAAIPTLISGALVNLAIPAQGVEHFLARIVVFLSSCDARRLGQWENTTWTDFVDAAAYGDDYRRVLIDTLSKVIQASKPERTSAQFPCHVLELVLYNLLGRGANGSFIQCLDRPTNEAWINPWLAALQGLGARLRLGHELTGFSLRNGRIAQAQVWHRGVASRVEADWYVCALSVDRARQTWSRAMLAADPRLALAWQLDTAWLNGLKFFLNKRTPITDGHVYYVDSPWKVTSVSQAQFWPLDFAQTYGDGRTHESLSITVSDWTTPGVLFGKPAADCTETEIIAEVWEQMKRHLNKPGKTPVLTDDLLVTSDIDHGMIRRRGRLVSGDPMVLPTVGQRPNRPDVATAIPNLILTGDYLQSEWEIATMETANYNGRRAANAILQSAGSRETPAATIPPYRPPEWEPLKQIDEQRWQHGQPNLFDTRLTLDQLTSLLGQTTPAAPTELIGQIHRLLIGLTPPV